MSMLSIQCDNLRLMAKLVRDYDYAEISRMLREAADTIEGLRDRLQELQGMGCDSRYTTLFGTPERAMLTIASWCTHSDGSCVGCPVYGSGVEDCSDCDALLEWLRGDA